MAFTPMKDLRGYMTQKQCEDVVNAAENIRDKLILRLLWRTGARVTEVITLTTEDLIPEERILLIRTLKRRKTKSGTGHERKRRIPIDEETVQLIIRYMKETKRFSGPLFKITRITVFNIVRRCGAKAGIDNVGGKRIHPHHFRHSFAVNWIKSGGGSGEGLRKLQMILGHTSINTTADYLQFSPTELREDYDKMWRGKV